MNGKFKRSAALLAAASMFSAAVPMIAAPVTASAADVGTTWKFDFGPEGQTVADGYYGVTPSTEYNSNSADGIQFGLYGQNENDYKLGNYEDGVTVKQGQVVSYAGAGSGSSADADRIGIGALDASQIPGTYPVRFSMDAENNGYYEVKVNVTTLDASSDATGVFVYSERRHPIVTNQTVAAGQTKTVTFRATVQSVLLKDRANGGNITYVDKKLNVLVMGTNAAISSIEVTKIDPSTTKTIWCYNDSTGCDYPMALPYFPLQNYGGTAQYLSKYLPNNVALVNQGDGGLASGASSYFNVCKNNFKAGDYVYLQYGHNESGAASYLKNLPTYYKYAHSVGANMVYAGPIDRHNSSQYTASTNTWTSTLGGYSRAAKAYTEVLICAGADAGDTFVSKAQSRMDDAYAYADEIIAAGITSAGVKDVAFVDLNAPTIEWLGEICTEVKNIKGASSYDRAYSDYYFRAAKDTSVDGTHENDYGADATASFFFDGIKAKASSSSTIEAVEYSILEPLITNMRADYGSWDHVTADVINAGAAPNSAWPDVFRSSNVAEYPTAVKSITWNSNGTVDAVTIVNQESTMAMDDYGMLKLDIYDSNGTLKGTIGSTQVDNTWGAGTTTVYTANSDTSRLTGDTSAVYDRSAGDTFTATIYRASKGDGADLDYITPLEAYSEKYVYTDYEGALITNEDGEAGEDFNFYGSKFDGTASAADKNGWKLNGSASKSANLYQDGSRHYMTVTNSGSSGSMNLAKGFESSPAVASNGRLNMSVDLRNASGNMQFTLASNYKANWPDGQTLVMFTISGGKIYANGKTLAGDVSGSIWQTVAANADLDRGTLTVTVGSGAPVTVNLSGLQKNTGYAPTSLSGVCIARNSSAGSVDVSNLSIDKYAPADDLDSKTLTIAKNGSGSVLYNGADVDAATAAQSSPVTLKAVPADFYEFTSWTDADGNVLSTEVSYTYPRLYEDATINANFTSIYGEGYEVSYVDGFKDDFEGETNIFGASDVVDTTQINANSVFGNVLRLSGKNVSLNAVLGTPVVLGSQQYLDLSFNEFTPYLSNDKDVVIALYGSSDTPLVSYAYNPGSTTVTSVKIGGAVPDDFEAFSWSTANSWNDSGKTKFDFTKQTNPGLVKIRVAGDKTASITFENNNGKATKSYSGILTDSVSINKISITKSSGQDNTGRAVGLDNFDAVLVSAPAPKYDYTVNAVDENNAVINALAAGSTEEGSNYSVSALNEVITDESGKYYRLNDTDVSGYAKSFTMGSEAVDSPINYRSNNAIVIYKEAEDISNATASDAESTSGGKIAAIAARKNGSLGTLPAGSYKITVGGQKNDKRQVVIRDGGKSISKENELVAFSSLSGTQTAELTLTAETALVATGYTNSSNQSNLSDRFDYIIIEAKPAVTLSDPIISTEEGSDKAKGYIADFTQNDYNTQSIIWHVKHVDYSENGNYMDVTAQDLPYIGSGTNIRIGLILTGNIDEVGEVTVEIK